MIGVGVVPNLFGEEVIIGFGGGKFDSQHDTGVSRAYALVETFKINSDGSLEQKVLGNWINALGAHVHALDDKLVVVEAGKVCHLSVNTFLPILMGTMSFSQATDDSDGNRIYVWDHKAQKPMLSGQKLEKVRHFSASVKVSSLYINCMGKRLTK